MICWATVIIMTMRLGRYENASPRSVAGAANGPLRPAGGYASWLSVVLGS